MILELGKMAGLQFMGILLLTSLCQAQDRDYWMNQAQASLQSVLNRKPNVGVAKNVILFLGDGMGVSTITAARILKGQMEGGTGEEYRLEMEKFPYVGLAKTYNTDKMTADSAGTATAYLSGVKTRTGVLGVDHTVVKGNCSNVHQAALETIKDWALAAGKSVGIVTTARITHATPAAAYAKSCHRDYECYPPATLTDYDNVTDVASQLVEENHDIHVLLGGGRKYFFPKRVNDSSSMEGVRKDGKNLVQKWKEIQTAKGVNFAYVQSKDELKKVNTDNVEYLFGLFTQSHLSYVADQTDEGPEPSITDMVEAAVGVLKKNPQGFFLLVEGGRIDHGHHDGLAHKALLETITFDQALTRATQLTDEKDTLILATADHSHVFAIAGYPDRGQNILGTFHENSIFSTKDGLPMTVLQYTNGPGPQRTDLRNVDTTDPDWLFPNGIAMGYETHGGEDVAVFARGPMAHLVVAVHEQNVLAHIMAYAACMGPDASHCQDEQPETLCPEVEVKGKDSSGSKRRTGSLIVVMATFMAWFLSQR